MDQYANATDLVYLVYSVPYPASNGSFISRFLVRRHLRNLESGSSRFIFQTSWQDPTRRSLHSSLYCQMQATCQRWQDWLLLCHTTLIWLGVISSALMWVSIFSLHRAHHHVPIICLKFSVYVVCRLAQKLMELEQRPLRRLSGNCRVPGRRPCKGKRLKRRNSWRRQMPN